jgi:hypothetical protein
MSWNAARWERWGWLPHHEAVSQAYHFGRRGVAQMPRFPAFLLLPLGPLGSHRRVPTLFPGGR